MSDVGTLYVVATPIGNIDDLSTRAISVLNGVDLIAAEDTRHSGKLLAHYGIKTKTTAFHDHNEKAKVTQLLSILNEGESIALISDAGTPLINDPGYTIVNACQKEGISVVPVPGACAAIASLSCSGLPSDRFSFWGFVPAKQAARQTFYRNMQASYGTIICYESTHRILDSLQDLSDTLGADTRICFAKELTKTYEMIKTDQVSAILTWLIEDPLRIKGEIVLLVSPPKVTEDIPELAKTLMQALIPTISVKQASNIVAKSLDLKKNALYKWALNEIVCDE